MGLRTAAQVQAEYEAAHAAYLKAVEAESYTIGSQVSRSVTRPKSESLLKQMKDLEAEYNRLSRGGLRVIGVIPSV